MTKLFIDIDGVLFANYGGEYQLRPYVNSFLRWANDNFACYFLTAWTEEDIWNLLKSISCEINPGYAEWSFLKTSAIERLSPDGDFYWLEDDPFPKKLVSKELSFLRENKWEDKLIHVNPGGANNLNNAIVELSAKANIECPKYIGETNA